MSSIGHMDTLGNLKTMINVIKYYYYNVEKYVQNFNLLNIKC